LILPITNVDVIGDVIGDVMWSRNRLYILLSWIILKIFEHAQGAFFRGHSVDIGVNVFRAK